VPTELENPCPECGRRRPGRPKGEVPVQNVLDALSKGEKVADIARALGIPRASVYRVKAGAGVKA